MPLSENSLTLGANPPAPLIREEAPLASDRWDQLLAASPGVSVFHSTAWAKVLSGTYGFVPLYLTAAGKDKECSALPILEINSWLTGKRGVSLPFTDECAALGSSGDAHFLLVQEAQRLGRARGWKSLELRGGPKPSPDAVPSLTFLGHKLKLSTNTGALFNRLESSVRRAIRKAEKAGLQVAFSQTLAATAEYYALHCQTRKEHGLPPQPYRFFRQIQAHILANNLGLVVTAKLHGRPVASAIFFHQGSTAIYKFGASARTARDLRANNLVMWAAIKHLAAQGIQELSFGRTSITNAGLRRYKLGWATEEYPIHYYKYDLRTGHPVVEKDAATGWYNRAFQILPTFLARWVGAILYRHIA